MSDTLRGVEERFAKRMDAIEKKSDERFAQLKHVVFRLRKAMLQDDSVEGEDGEGDVGNNDGGVEEKLALLHETKGREDKQAKFKSDFQKSYDESLFSLFQFLLFLYGYSGAIAATGLVWTAIVLFQYEVIDWSGESFKVPVLKPDVWMGPASYVGYIVPMSIYFFWINASFWNSGVKARGLEVYEYPFAPTSALLCTLTIYGFFQNFLPYLAFTQGGIDLMYTANLYLIIGAIGFVVIVIVYELLGQLGYDYFRGQGTSRKGASVEPVQELRENDESRRSGVGEAGGTLLLDDADEDETDATKASSAKDGRGRYKSDITINEARRSSTMIAGTAVDDLRKSLGVFKQDREKKDKVQQKKQSTSPAKKQEDEQKESWAQYFSYVFGLAGATLVAYIYPIIIVPVFNSDIGDPLRIFTVTVVHTGMVEWTLMQNRFNKIESNKNSKLAIQLNLAAYANELAYQINRRVMIQCMDNSRAVYITLALVGLEEGILRSTFTERDEWFRNFRGKPPTHELGEEEAELVRKSRAAQITHSMMAEIISIIAAKGLVIAARHLSFVLNVGYQNRPDINVSELITTMVVELAVEFCVDAMALNKEINGAGIPVHLFRLWLTKDIVLSHFVVCPPMIFNVIASFLTPAFIYFCPSRDPCSCNGGPYRLYKPMCSFLTETNVTKLREYDLYGYPGLSAEFITETGSNTSFGIDLERLHQEYRSPVADIPVTVREALATGVSVCVLIVITMYVIGLVLKRFGIDEESQAKSQRRKRESYLKEQEVKRRSMAMLAEQEKEEEEAKKLRMHKDLIRTVSGKKKKGSGKAKPRTSLQVKEE